MRDTLLAQPKDYVLSLFGVLNGTGKPGFDHERQRKAGCVDLLLSQFAEPEILAAIAQNPLPVSVDGPAPTPKATTPKATDRMTQLQEILADIAGGALNEDRVREIVAEQVKAAIDGTPITRIEVKRPDGTTYKPDGHVRAEFAKLLRRASAGLNILLVGPAGSGKTHVAGQVAEALGREFASISCTTGMSESQLSGWLLPTGDGGKFVFVSSDFVRLYENGGVFLFDEVDAADPNTLLFINQALANGHFYLPQREGNSMVKRHPLFVCIAAANTYGNGANGTYAGRERLDEAFLDRFRAGRMAIDYDTAFERKAVDPELLAWGWAARKRIGELRMQRPLSTRFLLDATKLLAVGETLKDAKEAFFLDWKAEDRMKVDV
jgi:MoxR-like ATPase